MCVVFFFDVDYGCWYYLFFVGVGGGCWCGWIVGDCYCVLVWCVG